LKLNRIAVRALTRTGGATATRAFLSFASFMMQGADCHLTVGTEIQKGEALNFPDYFSGRLGLPSIFVQKHLKAFTSAGFEGRLNRTVRFVPITDSVEFGAFSVQTNNLRA